MAQVQAYPANLFGKDNSHMIIFAHQDDELPNAGLIQRMGVDAKLLWITNGDGTAKDLNESPTIHAARREAETRAAMRLLNIPDENLIFLRHSELDLYEAYASLAKTGLIPPIFARIRDEVTQHLLTIAPETVWTQAYQGGHIEHDLAHLAAHYATNQWRKSAKKRIRLFELPAYEFFFAIPLRFKPWRKEPIHEIWLTSSELAKKHEMFELYPTQRPLLETFKKLISLYGKLNTLRLRPFDFNDFARREEFAEVPVERNHRISSHRFDALNYILERYEGTPLRFSTTTSRLAASLFN